MQKKKKKSTQTENWWWEVLAVAVRNLALWYESLWNRFVAKHARVWSSGLVTACDDIYAAHWEALTAMRKARILIEIWTRKSLLTRFQMERALREVHYRPFTLNSSKKKICLHSACVMKAEWVHLKVIDNLCSRRNLRTKCNIQAVVQLLLTTFVQIYSEKGCKMQIKMWKMGSLVRKGTWTH